MAEEAVEAAGSFLRELDDQGAEVAEFRAQFATLVEALQASHTLEQEHIAKAAEVSAQLDAVKREAADSQQEVAELQATKKQMEEEVARGKADIATNRAGIKEKEATLRELEASLAEMQAEVEAGADWRPEQEEERETLAGEAERLELQLDAKRKAASTARDEVAGQEAALRAAQERRDEAKKAARALASDIAAKRREIKAAVTARESADGELVSKQGEVRALERELEEKLAVAAASSKEAAIAGEALKGARDEMDKLTRKYDKLHERVARATGELDSATHGNEAIAGDLHTLETELADVRREVASTQSDTARVTKLVALTLKKIRTAQEQQGEAEAAQEAARNKAAEVTGQAEEQRKRNAAEKAALDDLRRQREVLHRSVATQADKVRKVKELLAMHKNTVANLTSETAAFRTAVVNLRTEVDAVQADRDATVGELEAATQRYFAAVEGVKVQELAVAALQRKIAEQNARLKQQQTLYETVRGERNSYSKQLIESQAAIEEMKRQFKTLNFQIQNLKDEITSKKHALLSEHYSNHSVQRQKDALAAELARVQKQIYAAEKILANQDAEVVKLNRIIHEADEERSRQEKELAAVISERDVLRVQLVRRDEELASLYEKLKVQKSTLARGAATYTAQMSDLHARKRRVGELMGELEVAKAQVANLPIMEKEVKRIEADLLAERTKVRKLEDELQRPVNVHRWRQLEVSDPERFAMLQKVSALQRQQIATQEAIQAKQSEIAAQEAAYTKLKEGLVRQPGPEMSEAVAGYMHKVKAKKGQLAALTGQLGSYKALVQELQEEMGLLRDRMSSVVAGWVRQQKALATGRALPPTDYTSTGSAPPSAEQVRAAADAYLRSMSPPRSVEGDLSASGLPPSLPGQLPEEALPAAAGAGDRPPTMLPPSASESKAWGGK